MTTGPAVRAPSVQGTARGQPDHPVTRSRSRLINILSLPQMTPEHGNIQTDVQLISRLKWRILVLMFSVSSLLPLNILTSRRGCLRTPFLAYCFGHFEGSWDSKLLSTNSVSRFPFWATVKNQRQMHDIKFFSSKISKLLIYSKIPKLKTIYLFDIWNGDTEPMLTTSTCDILK